MARRRRSSAVSPPRRYLRHGLVIASVEGRVGAVAFDSLVIEVGGIGYRVFASPAILSTTRARFDAQAPHVPPRPRGPAGALRLPIGGGAGVLHAAADRDRRRPEGGPRDRRVAPHGRPPARDHGPGPGRARVDPGHRQEARRADHLRAQGEGRGRRDRGERRRRPRASVPRRARSWRRSRRSGYSLAEAREASRMALAEVDDRRHARGPRQGRAAEPAAGLNGRVDRRAVDRSR